MWRRTAGNMVSPMNKFILIFFALMIGLCANSAVHAKNANDLIVVNTLLFDREDVRQNRKAMRRLRSIIRVKGAVFVWVAIRPQAIGFSVIQDSMPLEQKKYQMTSLRKTLGNVLADLHDNGQIERAPTLYQRGVSELVKVTDHRALRTIIEHPHVQQLTLDPAFTSRL